MDAERIVLIIISAVFGIMAVFCFRIAYCQHKEKGFIFTNKWLYASKKEREEMDYRIKKAEYRVGRNVFFILGVLLSVYAVYFQLWLPWLSYIAYALTSLGIIYALYQWIVNERLYKSIEDGKKDLR